MGKLSTPKKTRSIKRILISILYHDLGIDLIKLLDKIKISKNDDLLIIFDNINDDSLNQLLKKKYKNIKLFFGSRKVKKVPYYRNIALKKAMPNYEILLFLDSDVLPCKNIVERHYNSHKKYIKIPLIAGSVKPSFLVNQKTFWEKVDGCMSWFCSLEPKKNMIVNYPYHLATANISMKVKFISENKIKFDNNLITGEDVDLCNKIRNLKKDIMITKNMQVIHQDRKKLNSFLEHQKNWGKHHYHLRYKNNILFKKKYYLFYPLFFFFYPLLAPLISLAATYYNMKALIKFKPSLINLSIIIYLIYVYKSFYTYIELFTDLKSQKIKI
jgi:hypothetical protein